MADQQDSHVYHFTDTGRLPWIVAEQQLRPGRNQIGGYPDPDFVWATTSAYGDRTASGMYGYRGGRTALVRLTLHAEDFEPWLGVGERYPQWTPEQVHRLEAAARKRGETCFDAWRIRTEPLPLSRIIRVEAKFYTGSWWDIELGPVLTPHRGPEAADVAIAAIVLKDEVHMSIRHEEPGAPTIYSVTRVPVEDWKRAVLL
jgi:hypothetical protein